MKLLGFIVLGALSVFVWVNVFVKLSELPEQIKLKQARQERLMTECMQDKKEYECEALLNKKNDSGDLMIIQTY